MRLIAPQEYLVMPWKNGLGSTSQVCIFPSGASLSNFDARISIAHVGTSGAFSLFPGVDRTLIQLTGRPMVLHHPGESGSVALQRFEPYRFPGELATEATLEGEASDFNIMTRRGIFLTDVMVYRMREKERRTLALTPDVTLLFAAQGSARLYENETHSSMTPLPHRHTAVWNEHRPFVKTIELESQDDGVFFGIRLQKLLE